MGNIKDHSFLIEKILQETIPFTVFDFQDNKAPKTLGYSIKKDRVSSVVLAEDSLLELGSPEKLSLSRGFWTKKKDLVKNQLLVHTPDLSKQKGASLSFLHFVIIELQENQDPTNTLLFRPMNLTNKLPLVMTRTVPGKLWMRIHKKIFKKFSLYNFGQTIRAHYIHKFPQIKNIDIILAAGDELFISKFEKFSKAAAIISGENRRLQWEEDGIVVCNDLDCNVCDEKAACDTIREVVTFRRRNR
jgi:CO dehydrogenase/acetyl-CoA synthase beta subunit